MFRFLLLVAFVVIGCQGDEVFKRNECYEDNMQKIDERMPLSMTNLIALIEKYERNHETTSIANIAKGMIQRYKEDGIVYDEEGNTVQWIAKETEETKKLEFLNKILPVDYDISYETFEHREECALHFMLSHSMDFYRHPELEQLWNDAENNRRRRRSAHNSAVFRSVALPDGMDPAPHPVESGVMHTYYGPVSGGNLLYGLAALGSTSSNTIANILQGDDLDYMPSEMKTKRFDPVNIVTTLASEIGQAAMPLINKNPTEVTISSSGKFASNSACPQLFLLENSIETLITRAEILGSIDALLISEALEDNKLNMKLSEVLRMYYSDVGIAGNPDYKACNRLTLFEKIDENKIKEQARYFMYVLSSESAELRSYFEQEEFNTIEQSYSGYVENVWRSVKNFIDGEASNEYDCPAITNKNKNVQPEDMVDLIVVLGPESGTQMEIQQQYLTHLVSKIGVSYEGSRLGVLDGRNGQWEDNNNVMANHSNVADWGCNFASNFPGGGSSSKDMITLLTTIETYLNKTDNTLANGTDFYGGHSRVILWVTAKSFRGDENEFKDYFGNFTLRHPEISFILVGTNKNSYNFMVQDVTEDIFSPPTSSRSDVVEEFAETLAERLRKAPAYFNYPKCDSSMYPDFNEGSHQYTGYVSPNHTTYLKIGAKYFHFSEEFDLEFDGSDLLFCASRYDRFPAEGEDTVTCKEAGEKFTFTHPCGRYLKDCQDLYIGVHAKPTASNNARCNDDECQFPNQIEFHMKHDGLECGTCGLVPTPLVILLLSIVALLRL